MSAHSTSLAGNFDSTHIGHDSHGRLLIAWRRLLVPGAAQAFAWTSKSGRQQVSAVQKSVTDVSLAIAGNGRAALGFVSNDGLFVARRSPGSAFAAPESLAQPGTFASGPGVAVTRRGRVVAAWLRGTGVVARAAEGAAPFGPAQTVALRPAGRGHDAGRGPAEGRHHEPGAGGGGRLLLRAPPDRGRAAVRGPARGGVRLARARRAPVGGGDALAKRLRGRGGRGRTGSLGRDRVDATGAVGAPGALGDDVDDEGRPATPVYNTHALAAPVVLTPGPGAAVNVFYRAGGPRWFTVRLTAAGLYAGTSNVTPAGQAVALIYAASTGNRAAAAWHAQLGSSAGSRRVQVARP